MIAAIAQAAVTLTQGTELSLLVKATVVLLLGLAAARLAGRAPASVRHLLLSATLAAVIALPIAVVSMPGVAIQVPVPAPTAAPAAAGTAPASPSAGATAANAARLSSESPIARISAIDWRSALRWTWLAGTAALGLSLAVAFLRLQRIRRNGLPQPELQALARSLATDAGLRRSIDVLEHESLSAPLTCGVWKPVILLPADAYEWSDAELRRAFVHELEHVRRGDWAIQLAARAACACYWFHPLAWMALRRLCLEAERACDDAVVRGAERTDYADQLVLLARRMSAAHGPAMLGMANRSDLATRVGALLDDRQRRGRAGLWVASAAVIAAGILVTTIAPVRAIATAETPIAGRAGEQTTREREARGRVRGLDRALYEAAVNVDLEEVNSLLQAGANANAAIPGDGSALIAASRRNWTRGVVRLLDAGADPNLVVPGDGTALIAASREGEIGAVAILLDRGAAVDLEAPGDENALIQASGTGQLEVVKLLVKHGANVNARIFAESVRGNEWRTPLGMARRGGHQQVVDYLRSIGAVE